MFKNIFLIRTFYYKDFIKESSLECDTIDMITSGVRQNKICTKLQNYQVKIIANKNIIFVFLFRFEFLFCEIEEPTIIINVNFRKPDK